MERLKVFVSSTCYDLQSLRATLRDYICAIGHEAILSEFSDVLYDPYDHTHVSCVNAVINCDIMVLLIGGRFGGIARQEAISQINFNVVEQKLGERINLKSDTLSITYIEFLKAIECGIPVFTFIKNDVYSDHRVYETNKNSEIIDKIEFPSVEKQTNASKIFEFINIVRKRDNGNSIKTFDSAEEIINELKSQWSAYFCKLIREKRESKTGKHDESLEERIQSLESMVWKVIADSSKSSVFANENSLMFKRVLWVDDYPSNNKSVIEFFEMNGVTFDIAVSTIQGINLYQRNRYDLIITDMGRGNEPDAGLKLIQELNEKNCITPIVVYCSSNALDKYGYQALQFGAKDAVDGIGAITSIIANTCGVYK